MIPGRILMAAVLVVTVVGCPFSFCLHPGRAIVQSEPASEIAAQIEKARDLLRGGGRFEEALNILTPLLARLMMVSDQQRRIDLSADIFLLKGMAAIGMGDETAARRDFRSLYELGPETARSATKNVFDPKIVPLLKQVEREAQGLSADYSFAITSEPPGARIKIDGLDIGSTPALFKSIRPGKIIVELEKEGYRSIRDEVLIDQSEIRREYALTFAGLTLRIRSIPAGAKIFLDGRDSGKETEAEISGLSLEPHRLRLLRPGYRDWETTAEAAVEKPLLEIETRLIAVNYQPAGLLGGLESSLLKSPSAMAKGRAGKIAVADASDSKLKMIDETGSLLWEADSGMMAELGLLWIGGLVIDRAGNFILSDPENHVLLKLSPNGVLSGKWGSFGPAAEEFNTPLGLAADENGRIYIADSGNHRLKVLSPEGALIKIWGSPDEDPGRFKSPQGVAVKGKVVYVLDADRIQKFSLNGEFLSTWEPKGPEGEPIRNSPALAVDDGGCVYLTDSEGQRVLKYDSEGGLVCTWGKAGMEPGDFGGPWGLVVDDLGRVFVVERGNHRIQIFAPGKANAAVPDGDI